MFPCEMKEFGARPTLSIRFRSPVEDLPKHFGRVYGAIMQYLGELGEQPAGMPFGAYYNMDMQDLDVEAGFPVARPLAGKGEIKASEIPGGMFALCHYNGPYGEDGPAWESLMKFIADNGYTGSEVCYEWYLNDPEDVPPEEIRTDLAMPVTRVETAEKT